MEIIFFVIMIAGLKNVSVVSFLNPVSGIFSPYHDGVLHKETAEERFFSVFLSVF